VAGYLKPKGLGIKMDATWQYLTEKEVNQITRRALSTLRNDRHQGRGIPYRKIGRSVRYKLQEVVAFMEAGKVLTTKI